MTTELRTPWQDEYGMELQTSSISTVANFALDGAVGVGPNQYGLLLNNHPDILTNPRKIIRAEQRGLSTMKVTPGGTGHRFGPELHRFSIEFDVTAEQLAPIAWLFFQNGVTEGAASNYTKTNAAYTSSNAEVWATFLRKLSSGSVDESHLVSGVVCEGLTLRGASGGLWTASAQMIGRLGDGLFGAGLAFPVLRPDQPEYPYSGTVLSTPVFQAVTSSMEISFRNNVKPMRYAAQQVNRWVFGKIDCRFRFTIPWEHSDQLFSGPYAKGVQDLIIGPYSYVVELTDTDGNQNISFTAFVQPDPNVVRSERGDELMIETQGTVTHWGAGSPVLTITDYINRSIPV